jgi:hypothetical protein
LNVADSFFGAAEPACGSVADRLPMIAAAALAAWLNIGELGAALLAAAAFVCFFCFAMA